MVERFREVVFLEKLQGQGSQGVSAEDPQRSTIGCFWWRFGSRHSFPDSISSASTLSRSWVRSLGEVVSVGSFFVRSLHRHSTSLAALRVELPSCSVNHYMYVIARPHKFSRDRAAVVQRVVRAPQSSVSKATQTLFLRCTVAPPSLNLNRKGT